MKTTKEERDQIDERVFKLIEDGRAQTFNKLWTMMPGWPPNVATQLRHMSGVKSNEAKDRLVDRSLQRLRKAGKIEFVKGRWQVVVPMKVVLS